MKIAELSRKGTDTRRTKVQENGPREEEVASPYVGLCSSNFGPHFQLEEI